MSKIPNIGKGRNLRRPGLPNHRRRDFFWLVDDFANTRNKINLGNRKCLGLGDELVAKVKSREDGDGKVRSDEGSSVKVAVDSDKDFPVTSRFMQLARDQ